MKKITRIQAVLSVILIILFSQNLIWSQTTFYSTSSGNPAVLANWNTVRDGSGVAPANFNSGDIFIVQGTGGMSGAPHTMTVTAAWTILPNNTTGQVIVESGATLTLTTQNLTTPALQVDGILNINAGRTCRVNNGSSGADFVVNATGITNIDGTLILDAGTVNTVDGTINNANTFTINGTLTFNAGGIYNHNRDGGTIPNETYVAGSFCNVTGVINTVPVGMNRAFSNFTWNCPSQSVDITATMSANITGDLTITNTNGNDFILNNDINLGGNDFIVEASGIIDVLTNTVNVSGGATTISGTVKTSSATGFYGGATAAINNSTALTLNAGSTVNYNAAGAQNITGTAAMGANYSNLIISGSGTKTLANDVTINNNLTISAGTTLEVGNDNITVSGTTSISGTFSDNNGAGNTNLTNVTMQGGTLSHVDNVDISGTLAASSGTNTITGTGGITITGTTTINAGATLVNSGTGNNYYNGAVTNNGTWSSPGAISIRFQGGLTNNGTMSTTGTGTYTFDQFNQTIAGTQPIVFQGAVNISNGETLTNDNASGITIQGQLNGLGGASAFVNNTGRTLYYQNATMPMTTGNFTVTAANNNVYYSLTGAQTVRNTTYQNLFISGSGIKTANAAFTVQGNLNIASGATLYDNGNLITVNGNVTNNGAATTTGGAAGISITGAGGHTITGNGTYQRLTIATAGNTTTMVDGSASFSVDNLIVSVGTLVIGNNSLTINTQLTGTNLTASSAAGSSMVLNGTSPNFLGTAGVPSLVNFTLNNAAGTIMANDFEVTGTLNLTSGILDMNNFDLTLRGTPFANPGAYLDPGTGILITNGTFTIPAALVPLNMNLTVAAGTLTYDGALLNNVVKTGTLILGANDVVTTGNWSGNGTLNATTNSRKVTFSGGAAQTLSNGTYNFYDLEINKSANGLTLNRNINVAHNWELNQGTFTPGTFMVTLNGTTVSDIGGLLPTTFYNLRLNKIAGGTLSNNVTVTNNMNFNANGRITLGNWDFTVANPATISNANANRCFITNGAGRLVRTGAAGGFTFPVAAYDGASYYYAPVVFPAGASSNIGVRAVYGQHPDNSCGSEYLNQYWNISTEAGGNLAAGNYNFTPNAGLIIGSPESAYYYGGTWTASGAVVTVPFNINLPAVGASDEIDVSGIDNAEPTVLSITPSLAIITSANVGSSTFSIQVIFSESMDAGSPPSISLTPAQGATLTQQAGAWSTTTYANDTYTLYYDVASSGVWVDGIDITVSDGSDVCGNLQAAPYTEVDEFDIHMACLTPINAGPDQHLCEAVPGGLLANTVMAATDPSPATGTWSRVSGPGVFPIGNYGNINSSTTTLTGLAQGVHIFRWTISGGACDGDYDDVTIYNDQPTASDAGLDDESCDGTYSLLANNPVYGTGSWTVIAPAPPTVVFANNTLATTTVSNLSDGDNTLTWTITKGACSSSDAVVITNNTVAIPTAGPNQILCTNTTTIIGATVPGVGETGLWTVVQGGGTFTNPTRFNTTITSIPRRDNIYRWTISKGTGCSQSADVTISNYSVSANAGFDDYTCDGTYTLLGNTPASQNITIPNIPATGTWTTSGPGNIANPNLYNSYVDNLDLDANTFTWTITNGTCSASDIVIISNDMPTIPDAGLDDIFCGIDFDVNGEGYTELYNSLNGNAVDGARGETGAWTLVAGQGTFVDPTNTANARVTNLGHYSQLTGPDYWNQNPTVNTFRWTITYKACSLYDDVSIVNAAPFAANAGPDQTVCYDEANLNAIDHGSGAQIHFWSQLNPIPTGNPLVDANIANPNEFNSYVSNLQSLTTTFRWTKENTLTFAGTTLTCTIYDDAEVTRPPVNLGRPNAGPNQILCSEEGDMAASPADYGFTLTPPENVTGQWSTLLGNGNFADLTSPSTHVTNLAYQTNIFRWTVTYDNGAGFQCISTDDVDITNALPSNANAGPDQYVCTNTALLSADRPTRGFGEWSVIGGGGTISNTTCQDFSCNVYVSNMGYGENTFRWTMSNSYTDPASLETKTCTLTDEITVWNYEITANAGIDQTVCVDNATLTANQPSGTTGIWDVTGGGGNVTVPTSSLTTVTNLSPNINTLRWTLDNGFCSAEDYITITNNNPEDPAAGSDQIICTNSATLVANNPVLGMGTGVWSVRLGGGIISSSLSGTTSVSNIPVGQNTYRWTITKGLCQEFDEVDVYNNSVVANAGTDIDNICGQEFMISTVSLNAAPPNTANGETGNWTVVNSFGAIQTPSAFDSQVMGMDRGENIFRWTLSNTRGTVTCTNDDEVSVFVYIPSTADAGSNQTVCRDATTTITLSGNNPVHGNGTWSIVSGGGNIFTPTSFTTAVNNLAYDQSIFRWSIIDNPACPASTDDVMITNNYVSADAGPDQAVCSGTTTLAANDPNTFNGGFALPTGQWTVVQGVGLSFDSNTRFNAVVSNLDDTQTNILRWTVTKGACSDYDDVSIDNNFFTVTAGVNQTVCDNFTGLNGQQPGPSESGVWTVRSGGGNFVNASLYNTQVNNLNVGPNIFRWTVNNSTCSAYADVEVYYNQVIADAGIQDRVCNTTNYVLGGNNPSPASGNWVTLIGGASVTTPSLNNSGVTNLAQGQNTFQWTVERTVNTVTCSDVSTVNIFNDTPDPAIVEADNAVCANNTVITVTVPPIIGTGVWTANRAVTFDNASSYNANVSNLVLGQTTFTWTVTNNGCSLTDDVIITNNHVVANAGLDRLTGCANSITLSGNDPTLTQGTGNWIDFSGSGATITTPSAYNTTVTGLVQGTTQFQWTVSLGACVASDIVDVTNNQVTASAGADQTVCSDVYSPLDGNDVSGLGATGVWTSIGNTAVVTNSLLFNSGVTGLDPGLNTFRWTVTSGAEGCTDYDEVEITNSSITANAGVNFETCDANVTLGANDPSPATGYWTQSSGPPGVIFVNSTQNDTEVDGLIGGVYAFTWNVSNGSCSNNATVIVTNNTPQAAIAGTGAPEVCDGNGSLVGNVLLAGETGLWTLYSAGGILTTPSSNNTTVNGLQLGDNTFRWTISKGTGLVCTTHDDVTITNNQVVADAGPDRSVCATTAQLIGLEPPQGTGTWTKIGINPSTIVNNTLYNTQITNLADNTTHGFTWTVTKGACTRSDDAYITNNMVLADAGSNQSTCNNSINLDGNDVSGSGATGVWTKLPGSTATIVSPSVYNTLVTGLEPGINNFTWTVTSLGGCISPSTVEITYNYVTADAGLDKEVCDPTTTLGATGTGYWTQISGNAAVITNSTAANSSVSGLTTGNYVFRWNVSNNGCLASDDVQITNSAPQNVNALTSTPEICGGTASLSGTAPGLGETGQWSLFNASGTFTNSLANITNVSGLKPGINTFRWTLTKGVSLTCSDYADVDVVNNAVTANAFTSNNISCDGTARITGNDPSLQSTTGYPATGLWTVSTGATISNNTYYNNVLATNLAQGDNIFTWTVSKGACSKGANVTVTNNQVFATVGGDISVCGSAVTLNGVDPSPNSGVWTLETGDNPASISIVTPTLYNTNVTGITKTAIFKWTVTGTSCSAEDFVTINNNSILINDGVQQTICAYTKTGSLTADALVAGQTGVWTSAGSNPVIASPSAVTTAVSNLDNGSNVFFWTVTNSTGCTGIGRHEIINDAPSASNAGTDQNICSSSTALSANNPLYGTGKWTQTGGTTTGVVISNPSSSATAVTGLSSGNSTFTWTITNNACSSSDDVQVYNNSFVLSAGLDQTLCSNATSFNANAVPVGGTGSWAIVGGTGVIANTTDPTSAVTSLQQGTNTFRWTVTNAAGCTVSDDVQITNNQPPVPNVSANQTTCNNSITISGDAPTVGETGLWTVGSGSGTFSNATSDITTVTGLSDNNSFIWTITQGACSAFNTVTVTYNGVIASADDDIATCSDTETLTAAAPSVGTGVWTLQSGTGVIANATLNETTVSGLSQGVNVFRWTVTRNGCSDWDEIYITNNAPDAADAGTTINTCNANFNLLANNPLVGTGMWTKAVGSSATITNPTLYNTSVNMPIQAMPYSETFTWTITNGVCSDSDDVIVNNNAFTVYANADDYTCTGSYSLLGRDPSSVSGTATGNWAVISGSGIFNNSASYNATVSSMNPGVNSFRWTIVDKGCSGNDDVVITNNQVTATNTGFMTCNSSTPILANNPALQTAMGLWTVDNPTTQTIADATSYSTTVSGLVPGAINRLRWTVSKGLCSVSDTMNIEYYVPNANITIPDIAHGCADTVQLIADANIGTGVGVWTESTGSTAITFDNNTATTTIARNLPITNNTFIWTVTNRGCVSSDQVVINNSKPINTAGTDKTGCTNTFTMDAQIPTATGSGIWSLVSGTVSFSNNTLATTVVTASPGTNIAEWTITDNGCSASKRFNITNNLTSPNAGTDVAVCENRVQLSGSALKTGQSGLWSIDGGITSETFSSTTVNNPEVTNLRQGIVTFVWTVTNGLCTSEDRVVVTNNTPTVDAGPDRIICEDYVTLAGNNPDPGNTGVWSIGSGSVNIVNATAYNSSVTNLGQGSNLFTWTIDNGICVASDEVLITSNSIDVVAGIPYSEECADTLILEATQPPVGTTGAWTALQGGGTFDNQTSYSTIARNLGSFNKLRWTITSGTCSFYDEIDYVSLLPTQASTVADKLVCANSTQITANPPAGGETGIWTKVAGSSAVTIASPTSFQTMVTSLDQGANTFKWTISNASCSTSDMVTVTNNEVFANAGIDRVICDTIYPISANVTVGTGVWSSTTPGVVIANSTSPNTTVSGLAFGNNSFIWTLTYNGCSDNDEVIITSNLPRNVSAGSDQNICSGTTNLTATNPGTGTGLWTLQGGAGTFGDATANQTDVSGLAVGENIFKWTVTVGTCTASSQVRVNNNSLYVTAGTDQTLCNQDALVLDGTQPGAGITGTWSVNGGSGTFDNSTVFNTTVRGLTKGTNTYVWTLSDGTCSNSAEVEVINNTPDSAKVGADQFICANTTTVNAVSVSNGTGKWSLKSGSGVFANASSYNTTVSGINFGLNTYTWTVTKNGCSLSADIDVTNNSVSAYIADDDITICTPTHTATIIGNAVGTGETGSWSKISAGPGVITNSASNVTTVTSLGNGETYFRWTVSNGACSNYDDLKITNNYYNTTASAAGPTTLCVNYSPIIGGSLPIGATGKWSSTSLGVTFDNNTAVSTIARSLPGGTSTITWTVTKDGCSSPASFNLLNNAIYTSAGADQVVCQTTTNLNAQGLLPGESGYWTVNNGMVVIANSTNPASSVSGLITGDNTFTWTLNGNGCSVTDEVIVSNNTFSVDAGVNQISCGTSYTLRGSDPISGTGLWTIASGNGRFASPTNFETLVEDMPNGPNTFTWTVNRDGCVASANVTITNDLYIAVTGDDRAVCSSQTTVSAQPLNATWGASGMWTAQTGGGVFASPTSASSLVTGLSVGDNRLRWTVTKGSCVSYDEITITNNSVTASAGTDETTCDNFANLSATPLSATGTGLWTGGGFTTVIVTPTSASTAVTNLQQGINTFAWTVTDKGCTGTSTVRVTSNYFIARAGNDQNISVDNTALTAQLPSSTATGNWSVFSGAGNFANINDPTTTVTNLGYGQNTFRWTVLWNSCTAYDDVNIIYNAIFADAGLDKQICTTSTYLNADPPAVGTGRWSVVNGGGTFDQPDNPATLVTNILPGNVNIYRWTVSINGYDVYDDVTVINNSFRIFAGNDKASCKNTAIMTAEPAGSIGTGFWSVIPGAGAGTFTDVTANNTTVTGVGDGANLYVWTVTRYGCTDKDTVKVTYNVPPTADFDANPTSGCSPINVTYTNNSIGGSSYYWNFGDDQKWDYSMKDTTIEYIAYDTDSVYSTTLIAYSAAGCSDTIVKQITAYGIPKVDFTAYPATQQYPDATVVIENLSGSGYPNYYWTFGDTESRVDNSIVPLITHTYDTWGDYEITLAVSSSNCSDTVRQMITILAPLPANRGGRPYAGCAPQTFNLTAAIDYADTYLWTILDVNLNPVETRTEEDPSVLFLDPGRYYAQLEATGPGGTITRIDTIDIWAVPIVDFIITPDTVMLPNQPIHCYNRSVYGDIYEWDFGDTSKISNEENPLHYYTKEGTYIVTLRVLTENGCVNKLQSEVPIVVEKAGVCQFPNAFTPSLAGGNGGTYDQNNDVSNVVFHPVHRGIREYKLEIFNRWGEKLFESTNPNIGWDGYVSGRLAPQDVYVWKVTGKFRNGVIFKDAGDVTLLR